MEVNRCFEPSCMLEVECECECTSPKTYSCEAHFWKHLKLPNRNHNYHSIYIEPYEGTKEAILAFLAKERSKHDKLKTKIFSSFTQRILDSRNNLEELVESLGSAADTIINYSFKILEAKKISKSEQDPILGLLSLQPNEAVEKIKQMIPTNPDWYDSAKKFSGFSENIEKMIECFIKDKFEAHLDKRLAKIESTLEEHKKALNLTGAETSPKEKNESISEMSSELANIKNSITEIINQNKESKKSFDEWKEAIELKTDNLTSSLDSQIALITEDLRVLKQSGISPSENIIALINEKKSAILSRPNCPDSEKEFRKTLSEYEKNSDLYYDPPLLQAYQDFVKAYQQNTSTYILMSEGNDINLRIFNTENESRDLITLHTPEPLNWGTSITQIPDGRLFCFGNKKPSGITLIIHRNGEIQFLPPGTPAWCSSGIYFNNNVYFFGGWNDSGRLTRSCRYDLRENKWSQLHLLPQGDSSCGMAIFKGSILISGYINRNLLRYSIDNDNYTMLPYEFAERKRKILINEERLFLIECENGSIYESDIGSDTAWRRIADSRIVMFPDQVYCSYNKEAIYITAYIGCQNGETIEYYKFDLNAKRLITLN